MITPNAPTPPPAATPLDHVVARIGSVFDLISLLADPKKSKDLLQELRDLAADIDDQNKALQKAQRQMAETIAEHDKMMAEREAAFVRQQAELKKMQARVADVDRRTEAATIFEGRLRETDKAYLARERKLSEQQLDLSTRQDVIAQQFADVQKRMADLERREADFAARMSRLKELAA